MAGYCATALEVEQVLVLSSDAYCIYSRITITFVNKRAIAFRLYSVSLTMSCLSESKRVINSYKKTWRNPKFFME